jgi:hypothetical protein
LRKGDSGSFLLFSESELMVLFVFARFSRRDVVNVVRIDAGLCESMIERGGGEGRGARREVGEKREERSARGGRRLMKKGTSRVK